MGNNARLHFSRHLYCGAGIIRRHRVAQGEDRAYFPEGESSGEAIEFDGKQDGVPTVTEQNRTGSLTITWAEAIQRGRLGSSPWRAYVEQLQTRVWISTNLLFRGPKQ